MGKQNTPSNPTNKMRITYRELQHNFKLLLKEKPNIQSQVRLTSQYEVLEAEYKRLLALAGIPASVPEESALPIEDTAEKAPDKALDIEDHPSGSIKVVCLDNESVTLWLDNESRVIPVIWNEDLDMAISKEACVVVVATDVEAAAETTIPCKIELYPTPTNYVCFPAIGNDSEHRQIYWLYPDKTTIRRHIRVRLNPGSPRKIVQVGATNHYSYVMSRELDICRIEYQEDDTLYFPQAGTWVMNGMEWKLAYDAESYKWLSVVQAQAIARIRTGGDVVMQKPVNNISQTAVFKVVRIFYKGIVCLASLECSVPGGNYRIGDSEIAYIVQLRNI